MADTLPTPNCMDMLPPHTRLEALRGAGRGGYANLRDEDGPDGGVSVPLLSTPTTMDTIAPRHGAALDYVLRRGDLSRNRRSSTGKLGEDVDAHVSLLPTPDASNGAGRGGQDPRERRAGGHAVGLKDEIEKGEVMTNGRYEGSDSGFMPTPRARDVKGHNQRRNQDCLEGAAAFGMKVDDRAIMPTPCAFDPYAENLTSTQWRPGQRRALDLPAAMRMTMTGRCPDGTQLAGFESPRRVVDWGRFEPAVRRWEAILGRPAPCPTEATGALKRWLGRKAEPQWLDPCWLRDHAPRPDGSFHLDQPERDRVVARWRAASDGLDLLAGFWRSVRTADPDACVPSTLLPAKCVTDYWDDMRHAQWRRDPDAKGAYRPLTLAHLSPKLSEWMMGLPDGWVTDPAIWRGVNGNHRNMELKLCGNGVVPQQAAAAISWALEARRRMSGR